MKNNVRMQLQLLHNDIIIDGLNRDRLTRLLITMRDLTLPNSYLREFGDLVAHPDRTKGILFDAANESCQVLSIRKKIKNRNYHLELKKPIPPYLSAVIRRELKNTKMAKKLKKHYGLSTAERIQISKSISGEGDSIRCTSRSATQLKEILTFLLLAYELPVAFQQDKFERELCDKFLEIQELAAAQGHGRLINKKTFYKYYAHQFTLCTMSLLQGIEFHFKNDIYCKLDCSTLYMIFYNEDDIKKLRFSIVGATGETELYTLFPIFQTNLELSRENEMTVLTYGTGKTQYIHNKELPVYLQRPN